MRARKNGKEANGHVPTEITDPTDIKIIGVYLVQTLGHPSLDEILEVCRNKIKCEIHPHLMEAALKGAQKQGFVATGSKRNTQNQTVTSYTMKNLIWKQPPEYAHILDLLPVLLHTVRRSEWKAFFDEKEGRGERKKRRGNDIDDYHAFRVKIVTLDPLLGSQISCAFTDAIRKRWGINQPKPPPPRKPGRPAKDAAPPLSSSPPPKFDSIFEIDAATGQYVIPSDVLLAWWRTNASRYAGLPESKAEYIGFSPIKFTPKPEPMQLQVPVSPQHGGSAAPKIFEAVMPGQELTCTFVAPTKGGCSSEGYKYLWKAGGRYPRRGISPGKGRRYGKFELIEFEDLGSVKKPTKAFMEAVFGEAGVSIDPSAVAFSVRESKAEDDEEVEAEA